MPFLIGRICLEVVRSLSVFFVKEMLSMIRQKAIVYVRQSSGKEEESESLELQKQHCLELAGQKNLDVTGIFEDPNSSGRLYPAGEESLAKHDTAFQQWRKRQTSEKSYRIGLGNAFKQLAGNSYIIVDDLTRLARPVSGSFLQNFIQQQLVANHVKILTVKDGEVNYEDFCDRLMSDIQSTITDNQIRSLRMRCASCVMRGSIPICQGCLALNIWGITRLK